MLFDFRPAPNLKLKAGIGYSMPIYPNRLHAIENLVLPLYLFALASEVSTRKLIPNCAVYKEQSLAHVA